MDGEVNNPTARIVQDVKRDETDAGDGRRRRTQETDAGDGRRRRTQETDAGDRQTHNTTHLKELGD